MSKYHAGCTKSEDKLPKRSKAGPPLTSKPFCDCRRCACKNCPDILQMLSITVTEKACDFGSKGTCKAKTTKPKTSDQSNSERDSLLDVINPDRDCSCEVMARAIRSNIHMNLGMTNRRNAPDHSKKSNSTNPNNQEK